MQLEPNVSAEPVYGDWIEAVRRRDLARADALSARQLAEAEAMDAEELAPLVAKRDAVSGWWLLPAIVAALLFWIWVSDLAAPLFARLTS